jgi:hypothetical protein
MAEEAQFFSTQLQNGHTQAHDVFKTPNATKYETYIDNVII